MWNAYHHVSSSVVRKYFPCVLRLQCYKCIKTCPLHSKYFVKFILMVTLEIYLLQFIEYGHFNLCALSFVNHIHSVGNLNRITFLITYSLQVLVCFSLSKWFFCGVWCRGWISCLLYGGPLYVFKLHLVCKFGILEVTAYWFFINSIFIYAMQMFLINYSYILLSICTTKSMNVVSSLFKLHT